MDTVTRRQALKHGAAVSAVKLSSAQEAAALDVTPTPVKSADYTAAPGDFVPVDASGNSVTITLPAGAPDHADVGVKVVAIKVPFTVTVSASNQDVFNVAGGPQSLTLSSLNEGILLEYAAGAGIWYGEASAVSFDVARGAARLGTDGTVGGPSASPLSANVALLNAPNVFVASTDGQIPITVRPHSPTALANVFEMTDSSGHPIVWIESNGRLRLRDDSGNDHTPENTGAGIDIFRKYHAISMWHSVDWSSQSNAGHDLEDSVHRSRGDCHYMVHLGGKVPSYSFTANSDGKGGLSSVSGFSGLGFGVVFNGPDGEVLTVVSVDAPAGTLSYSGPKVPAGSGLAFSYSTPTDKGTGGDGTLNLMVPYWMDHIAGNASSAPNGAGVLNNRTTQVQILAQVQPVGTGQPGYNLTYQSNSQAVRILNAFTNGGTFPASGTSVGLQVNNFSTAGAIQITNHTAPVGNSAAFSITDGGGTGMPVIRVNDSSGHFGFLMLSDGTFQAAGRPSTKTPRATVSDFISGVSDSLRLINNGAGTVNAAGDGAQLSFGIGSNRNAGIIRGVVEALRPTLSGSLRFFAAQGTSPVERLRLGTAGIGVFSKASAPAPQQTAKKETAGYSGGSGASVTVDGTFTGAVGSTAYTVGDIVTALKAYGWLVE